MLRSRGHRHEAPARIGTHDFAFASRHVAIRQGIIGASLAYETAKGSNLLFALAFAQTGVATANQRGGGKRDGWSHSECFVRRSFDHADWNHPPIGKVESARNRIFPQ